MEQQQRNAPPGFYKIVAILFYLIGGILVFMAITRRDWFYGAIGGITLLNAVMTTIKLRHMPETGK